MSADDHKSPLAHVPDRCRAGLAVANAGKPLAGYQGDTTEILDKLRGGNSVKALAAELGISKTSLYEWLLLHNPEAWKSIVASKALERVEAAEEAMDAAQDQVQVSKARESHRMGAWALEKVARAIYGENKNGSGDVTVQVLIQRDGEVLQAQIVGERP